jgi:hypothetical protein
LDWLTFLVEMTKALAWPLVTLAVAIHFRGELRSLLHRVRKGKVGLAEFEFEQAVATLRERIGPPDAAHAPAPPMATIRQVEKDPRSVILGAWLEVQMLVDSIVAKHATDEDRRHPGSISLPVLHRLLRDKPEYIDMYNDLKGLRNQAVHEANFSPRPASVVEFAELAGELQAVLRRYAQ